MWVIALIVSVVAVLYGLGWAGSQAFDWLGRQSSEVAGAVIAFMGTVTAGIGAVVVSQQRTKKREIAESHRPKKTEIYSGFIRFTVETMRSSKSKKSADATSAAKLEKWFFEFTQDIMLWGSPKVLNAYTAFRTAGQQENPQVIILVDDILRAMRKDLGLSNWGLQRGDLIKMLLTDPEKVDAMLKERPGN